MTDIFKEVEEDIRRDQLKKLWDRFGPWVIGLAVLIVAVTAGYRGWTYWQQRQAEASGDKFIAATKLTADGKHDEAIAAYQELVDHGSGGYPALARFSIASEKARAGDKPGAVEQFDKIAADGGASSEVRNLAKMRAAVLLADTATPAELEQRIGDLATTGNPWRLTAREMLGVASYRAGDFAAARKYFDQVVSDEEAPPDMRQRSRLMLSLIAAAIGPEPAPAPAASAPLEPPPAEAAPAAPDAAPPAGPAPSN